MSFGIKAFLKEGLDCLECSRAEGNGGLTNSALRFSVMKNITEKSHFF